MALDLRFAKYEHVDTGVLIVGYQETSPIMWCNRRMANLLNSHPDQLVEKSLDEVIKSDQLCYERARKVIENPGAVAVAGGLNIEFYSNFKPHLRPLRLTRVQKKEGREATFLVGYLRPLTRVEKWIWRSRLDRNIDFIWKPIANFFLSGRWRFVLSTTAPLWGYLLAEHAPEIGQFLENLSQM